MNVVTESKAIEYSLNCKKSDFPKVQICSSADAFKFISQFYSDDINIFESVFILLLNRSNHTVGYAKISQGGISSSVVDIMLVCKYAIDSLATGVILAHNHPSGNLTVSESDKLITEKVKNALTIVDSKLLDHLIITDGLYTSMADDNTL